MLIRAFVVLGAVLRAGCDPTTAKGWGNKTADLKKVTNKGDAVRIRARTLGFVA
jgi:hypothetical protein